MQRRRSVAAIAITATILGSLAVSAESAGSRGDLPGKRTTTAGTAVADLAEIVITGTRLARPARDSMNALTELSPTELLSNGSLSLGDSLNEQPVLRSTFSQANSTRYLGTAGLNLLDLRGLGTERTLVLVNGRRHITALPGESRVDINTIPPDLLARVEIVTGGNSAIYGSDAIAGVVNFVLKRTYEGIAVHGRVGQSSRQLRGSHFGSLAAGHNVAEGAGNIAVALEFSHNDAYHFTERDDLTGAFSGASSFNLATNSALDGPTGSDGISDNQFFTGLHAGAISDGGTVSAVCNAASATNLARCRASGFAQRYMFDASGNLVPSNPTIDFRDVTNGASTSTVGGMGSTLRNFGQFKPELSRVSLNALAHLDVSAAVSPFAEAKFVRITADQESAPSFWQGSVPGFFGGGAELQCNNPYLSAQALATLTSIGRCVTPAATILLSRNNVDFGSRREGHERDTFQIVAGIEGNLVNGWHYEVASNFGHLKTRMKASSNLLLFDIDGRPAGFLNALDATRNAAGQIVCRINAVSVTDAACVPLNVFGAGQPSAAAIAYSNATSVRTESASNADFTADLRGDLSSLMTLPGGPVRFAMGAEYRREASSSSYDALTASGATFLNAIQPFMPPDLRATETYGELEFPVVKGKRMAKDLTVSLAGRSSSYNSSAGTVTAYNVGGMYAPIEAVRLRGNFSRSVRVPTQGDLYLPLSQGFAIIGDPCDALNINSGTASRAANCAAAGVPSGFVNATARSQSLPYLSGGNPTLTAETSSSYTFGTTLQPLPGFALAVDYYNIDVRNLISPLSAQQIVRQCYDSTSPNNPFCSTVHRDPITHEFAKPAVVAGGVNFARQKTSGIDLQLTFSNRLKTGARLSYKAISAFVIKRQNYVDVTDTTLASQQKYNLGDPAVEGLVTIEYQRAKLTGRYQFRYVGRQTIGSYEAQNGFQGRPPQNLDQFPQVWYPVVTYSNIRLDAPVTGNIDAYVGVDNVFDVRPPLGLTATGSGSAIYDNVGRYLFTGLEARF